MEEKRCGPPHNEHQRPSPHRHCGQRGSPHVEPHITHHWPPHFESHGHHHGHHESHHGPTPSVRYGHHRCPFHGHSREPTQLNDFKSINKHYQMNSWWW